MDFLELARKRVSVRAYKSEPVPQEKLDRILEAGRLAPTACNLQAFSLIVLHTAGRTEDLKRIYPEAWFAKAPIVIVACGLPQKNWVRGDGRNYVDVDVAIVMDHIILAASAEGLGTCWIGAFDPSAAREILGLPEGVEPIVMTPLGFSASPPMGKRRKPLKDLVRFEKW